MEEDASIGSNTGTWTNIYATVHNNHVGDDDDDDDVCLHENPYENNRFSLVSLASRYAYQRMLPSRPNERPYSQWTVSFIQL